MKILVTMDWGKFKFCRLNKRVKTGAKRAGLNQSPRLVKDKDRLSRNTFGL